MENEIERLKELLRKSKKNIIEIGRLLNYIRRNKLYKERSFTEFLKNLGISRRTAEYYVRISQLENAEEMLEEIGYTKLIVLLQANNLSEEAIEAAKQLSVSKLKEYIQAQKKKDKEKEKVEKVKRELEKIIKKTDVETFKKAFIEVITTLKGGVRKWT